MAKKRVSIQGLLPDEDYVIQVRAKDEGSASTWSQKYNIKTIDDTAGGTRYPQDVVLDSFDISSTGQFTAVWQAIQASTDGTAVAVRNYEVSLTASTGANVIIPHFVSGPTATPSWNLGQIARLIGGGVVPSAVTAKVRALSSAGTPSENWSNEITAAVPVPYPPTNPDAEPIIDGIKVKWEQPAEPHTPGDPRWPLGYRVYLVLNPDVNPDVVNRVGLIYEGPSLEAMYVTMSYETNHYFKICAYSAAGLQSDYVTTGPHKPLSPFVPDLNPPAPPTLTSVTMNDDRSVSGRANLKWTFNETTAGNEDVAGFVVAWRISGELVGGQEVWRKSYFDKSVREGIIDLPQAFSNYEFKISAYDFLANYSAYSAVQTLDGAGPVPPALTGLGEVPRWDGMKLLWNHSTSQSVLNNGRYEIQHRLNTPTWTDSNIDYTTRNRELDIAGIQQPLSTWYWRVRPVDSMGRAGPWSAIREATLPPFPTSSATDNLPPDSAPQNVRVAGGLNYLNVAWDRVPNTDPVTYEVHVSETNNFTPSGATLAGTTPATSLMVNTVGVEPMEQNTTYYVKVRATDADTKTTDTPLYSTQKSGQLTQIAGGDLGINMSGENLLINSSFEEDSNGDNIANYWSVLNGNPSATPVTPTLPSTGRTGGKAQRIHWSNSTSGITKGVKPNGQSVVRPHTEYTLSFYARGGAGTAGPPAQAPGVTLAGTSFDILFSVAPAIAVESLLDTQSPLNSWTWNRYSFKFTTGSTVDPDGFAVTVLGHTSSTGGWIEFDDIQLEAGNVASAYKTGTVSVAKLVSGRMSTAEMIIDNNGIIRSDDYNATTKLGFAITRHGIDLFEGKVNAAVLEADSTITNKLFVGADLEIAPGGKFFSTGYRPAGTNGPTDKGTGFRMDSATLDIRSGTVAAGALAAGEITSPLITIGSGGKITVASNGSIQSNNYNGPNDAGANLGWKISESGIEMWDTNSKINVNILETGTLTSTIITLGSGGEVKSATWDTGVGPRFRLSNGLFSLKEGIIEGTQIQTDQITSIKLDSNGLPIFSVTDTGGATFSSALIYGNTRVGAHPSHVVQSYGYAAGSAGWAIRGDGYAEFTGVTTRNLTVQGHSVVGGGGHLLQSASFTPFTAGWRLTGDGSAEFNGGWLGVGNVWGGLVALSGDAGRGELRMYPLGYGIGSNYNNIRSENNGVFSMRGYSQGAVEIHPGGHISLASQVSVSNTLTVNGGTTVGGLTVNNQGSFGSAITVGGHVYANNNVRVGALMGTGGQRYVVVGDGGFLSRGGATSSREIKRDIRPLDTNVSTLLALEPKSFGYKADPQDAPRSVGFIVEDADELGLSDYVDYDTETGKPQAFDYPFFTTALQQVNRYQQAEIETLKSELTELRTLVNRLANGS